MPAVVSVVAVVEIVGVVAIVEVVVVVTAIDDTAIDLAVVVEVGTKDLPSHALLSRSGWPLRFNVMSQQTRGLLLLGPNGSILFQ